MADTRKIIKIFLASPSDLGEERRAAKDVVDEFNRIWADYGGYQVELVGWEDTVSRFGRPQEIINRDLEQCEFFVGLMWKKWGTPPTTSGSFTSGFEEEFRLSVDRRANTDRPEISLFFKTVDPDQKIDPGPQLSKVLAFRDELDETKIVLYDTFDDLKEFELKLRACISNYVQRLQKSEVSQQDNWEGLARSSGTDEVRSEVKETLLSDTPLSVKGAEFLRNFIAKTEGDLKQSPIMATEVARFRLLGHLVGASGNDDQTLGVHDANLLFANRTKIDLSSSERMNLFLSGLANYSSENVPLWHWIKTEATLSLRWLELRSMFDEMMLRVGALGAMRLIAEPLHPEPPFEREAYIESWFAKDSSIALKVAALKYLSECGIADDLPAMKSEFDRGNYQTTSVSSDAILRINLRDSREKAILALFELQPESVDPSLLDALFKNNIPVSTDILLSQGIGHRNASVRHLVVKLLMKRDALEIDMAEQLTSDNFAEVRLEALMSLVERGQSFTDDEAKKILVKPQGGGFFGGGRIGTDTAGEACWERFRAQRMRRMKFRELEQVAISSNIFDRSAEFVLIERQFSTRGGSLRKAVENHYKAEFAAKLEELEKKQGDDPSLMAGTKGFEEILRKGFTLRGLELICNKRAPKDVDLVRDVLSSGFVSCPKSGFEYLQKYGEWDDIPLIITAYTHSTAGLSIAQQLSIDNEKLEAASRAIYNLGKARFEELLNIPMPYSLLSRVIFESSQTVFVALSNSTLLELLNSDDHVVRKVVALSCIRALPKRRLVECLDEYLLSDDYRYYNVIHWLDFGVSIPGARARPAASRELQGDFGA